MSLAFWSPGLGSSPYTFCPRIGVPGLLYREGGTVDFSIVLFRRSSVKQGQSCECVQKERFSLGNQPAPSKTDKPEICKVGCGWGLARSCRCVLGAEPAAVSWGQNPSSSGTSVRSLGPAFICPRALSADFPTQNVPSELWLGLKMPLSSSYPGMLPVLGVSIGPTAQLADTQSPSFSLPRVDAVLRIHGPVTALLRWTRWVPDAAAPSPGCRAGLELLYSRPLLLGLSTLGREQGTPALGPVTLPGVIISESPVPAVSGGSCLLVTVGAVDTVFPLVSQPNSNPNQPGSALSTQGDSFEMNKNEHPFPS